MASTNPVSGGTYTRIALIPLLLAALNACTPGMGAAVQSIPNVFKRGPDVSTVRLDPNFLFLRTTLGARVGFAWLGNTERNARGPVEVFYSGAGEVVRLQNGRIVSAIGFPTEWRKVEWPQLPSWSAVANTSAPVSLVRVRDLMPGYRTGMKDELTLRVIEAPTKSALRVLEPGKLIWFEERFPSTTLASGLGLVRGVAADDALPPARYAVQIEGEKETVVYSEQCLAKDFCFTWQRWSAAMQAAETGGKPPLSLPSP